MISAKEIFELYLQSERQLRRLSSNPFYKKSPDKLEYQKWTQQKFRSGYSFKGWAKDHYYNDWDEICVAITDYKDGFRDTIFIYTPEYHDKFSDFYVCNDFTENDNSKIGHFHIYDYWDYDLVNRRFSFNDIDSAFYVNNKKLSYSSLNSSVGNYLCCERQNGIRGPIKVDNYGWHGYSRSFKNNQSN